MRVLRAWPTATIWLDTEPEALEAVRRHLETYKIGREVEVEDVSAERAILSLIGPRAPSVAGIARPLARARQRDRRRVGGVECLAVGTDGGIDLICAAARPGRLRDALLAAGRRRGRAPRRPRSSGSRPAARASAPRWAPRRCPPRPASSSARSASPRAATSARRRSPASTTSGKPNRHLRGLRLSGPAERRRRRCALGEKEVGAARQLLRLPRPRPDRAGDRAPRGRARRRARRR